METIQYHRRPNLPGIELRSVRDSARCFRHYSTGFEFLAPSTWRGEVWHRRRREVLQPGGVLSSHPGDVFVGERVLQGGSWSSLTIDPDALASFVAEPAAWNRLQLRPFAELSDLLATPLFGVCQALRSGAELAEIRAGLRAFLKIASRELLDVRGIGPYGAEGVPSRAADLTTETGLSRFQALRAFKRHFGLTPHCYQLRVRLGLAQKSLREGARPADVAMDFGFVDQSHLTRHFKRFVGVTPAEYARSTI